MSVPFPGWKAFPNSSRPTGSIGTVMWGKVCLSRVSSELYLNLIKIISNIFFSLFAGKFVP